MDKHTSICAICGKSFYAKPSQRRKYCSPECYKKHRIEKVHITTCINCGKQFRSRRFDQRKFCSRKCFGEYERVPRQIEKCEVCGKTHKRYRCKPVQHTYCSRKCKWIGDGALKAGANSHFYRGGMTLYRGKNWTDQRKLAIERDGCKCQVCGKQLGLKKYDHIVHHIKPYSEFNGDYVNANKLTNLITLCRPCHGKVERAGLPCPRPLF